MLVLKLQFEESTYEVHTLNVGERFPNFGGSRHDLIARKTASLIISRHSPHDRSDTEYDIHNPHAWAWIAKLINDRSIKVTASSAKADVEEAA